MLLATMIVKKLEHNRISKNVLYCIQILLESCVFCVFEKPTLYLQCHGLTEQDYCEAGGGIINIYELGCTVDG